MHLTMLTLCKCTIAKIFCNAAKDFGRLSFLEILKRIFKLLYFIYKPHDFQKTKEICKVFRIFLMLR